MTSRIQAIDKNSVHRICSGQVILDLGVAVKELVENSLDAGATSIDVKFKNYGLDGIDVVDNGCGVEEENYEGLTRKYCTSKLHTFDDLTGVETFGFRGEALSSLCALGQVEIITRTKAQTIGTKLEFDHGGAILRREPIAHNYGTTVSVSKLFESLPVRFKEFSKNIKREYTKALGVLQAYAIISVGVKLNCYNQTKGGRSGSGTVILNTQGGPHSCVRQNILNIFGVKQLNTLLPVDWKCEDKQVKISGFVSAVTPGSGRGSGDRQFLFVNGRPVDMPKLAKRVNEVYRQFNFNQMPFFVLAITLDRGTVDVNVTPDKRKVMLHNENSLLDLMKEMLTELYEPSRYTLSVASTQPSSSSSSAAAAPSSTSTPNTGTSSSRSLRSTSTPTSGSDSPTALPASTPSSSTSRSSTPSSSTITHTPASSSSSRSTSTSTSTSKPSTDSSHRANSSRKNRTKDTNSANGENGHEEHSGDGRDGQDEDTNESDGDEDMVVEDGTSRESRKKVGKVSADSGESSDDVIMVDLTHDGTQQENENCRKSDECDGDDRGHIKPGRAGKIGEGKEDEDGAFMTDKSDSDCDGSDVGVSQEKRRMSRQALAAATSPQTTLPNRFARSPLKKWVPSPDRKRNQEDVQPLTRKRGIENYFVSSHKRSRNDGDAEAEGSHAQGDGDDGDEAMNSLTHEFEDRPLRVSRGLASSARTIIPKDAGPTHHDDCDHNHDAANSHSHSHSHDPDHTECHGTSHDHDHDLDEDCDPSNDVSHSHSHSQDHSGTSHDRDGQCHSHNHTHKHKHSEPSPVKHHTTTDSLSDSTIFIDRDEVMRASTDTDIESRILPQQEEGVDTDVTVTGVNGMGISMVGGSALSACSPDTSQTLNIDIDVLRTWMKKRSRLGKHTHNPTHTHTPTPSSTYTHTDSSHTSIQTATDTDTATSHSQSASTSYLKNTTAAESDVGAEDQGQETLAESEGIEQENDNVSGGSNKANFVYANLLKDSNARERGAVASGESESRAEAELQRVIKKQDFLRMAVVGQFNLGFILVRLNKDIFIVDQHASDEKYNFETLQDKTTMHIQRLIQPLDPELTAAEELIVMDNLEIFRKNGFDFRVDEDAAPTKRLGITTLPYSKNTSFGVSDVHELVTLLRESPGEMCRPSRVTSMFASRACRSSIMIGTALDTETMKRVITHMSEIDQPWNCPHGRPTMRHVTDLSTIVRTDAMPRKKDPLAFAAI